MLSLYENLDVKYVKIEGDTLFVEINGRMYGYTPVASDVIQLTHVFQSILKHSPGRAIVWLKKNASLVTGSAREPVTATEAITEITLNRLLESGVVDTVVNINKWWESPLGLSISKAISEWIASRVEDKESKRERFLYRSGTSLSLLYEDEGSDEVNARYNLTMSVLSASNLSDSLEAIDIEKDVPLVYLFFNGRSDESTVSNFVKEIKSKGMEGSELVATPEDVELEDSDGFWVVIVSKEELPEFPIEVEADDVEIEIVDSNEEETEDLASGEVEIES